MKFVGGSPSFSRGQIGGTLRGVPGIPETIPETLSKPRSRSVENIHRLKDVSDFVKLQEKAPDILHSNETIESILRLLKQKPKVTQPQEVSVISDKIRSSRWRCFVKTGVLTNFANFTGKHLRWSLFLIKLQVWRPTTLLKGDSSTGDFL